MVTLKMISLAPVRVVIPASFVRLVSYLSFLDLTEDEFDCKFPSCLGKFSIDSKKSV